MSLCESMIDSQLKVFVDSLANCFENFSQKKEYALVGAPFLVNNINDYLNQYTGRIKVSGTHAGTVYFTAPEALLKNLLWTMKILDSDEAKLKDLVGEIGNVVSGNARKVFGEHFLISPPALLEEGINCEKNSQETMSHYVIPVKWKHQKANLIIDLD